jgi:PAS domain S-box-containing protein
MISAPLPADEAKRLARLRALAILDSGAEPVFDSLTRVASAVCGVPVALISLVDANRQWFKSNLGLEGVSETPRDVAFCAHAILGDEVLEVPDATLDPRFVANPLVTGDPLIRFYAGAPLIMDGERIGTLCVIDRRARSLTPQQREVLRDLAIATVRTLEQREQAHYLRLTSSESKFQALSDFSPLGVFHADAEGVCTYVNTRWQAIFGLSLGESLGQGWSAALHPAERERVVAEWRQGIAAGAEIDMTFRVVRDGQEVHVRAQARPARTADEAVAGYVGVVEDISARKAAEDQLRASNVFLDRAERVSGVGGWELDLRARSARWTDQTCRIYDMEPGHQPTWDEYLRFVAGEARQTLEKTVLDCAVTGNSWELELPMVTARGRGIWVRAVGEVVEADHGKPVRLVGSLQDITEHKTMRDQLRRTNTLLETILESLPCGVSAFDGELRLVAHNRRFRELLDLPDRLFEKEGPDFESFVRFNVERAEYGEDVGEEAVARLIKRATESTGSSHQFERIRPDGTALDVRGAPMPGGGFVSTYTDISQRKRSEAELRVSEERQQRALEASGLALWDFDVQCNVAYLSAAWSEMLGGPKEPVVTSFEGLAALVPLEDQDAVRAAMTPMLKGQVPAYSVEHRVRRADGSLAWIQSDGRVAQRDAQGRATRVVGTNKDITERKRVQDELKQTSSLLKAVLDAATGVGIICAGVDGVISVFNKGAERLLGYSSDELVGRRTFELFHAPEELETFRQEVAARLGGHRRLGEGGPGRSKIDEREWTYVRKDGSRFRVALSVTPVRSVAGELLGFLGTCHDVTEQRAHERYLHEAREAAEQGAQAKATFLATMSHEIRTPVNGVIGMTSLLLDTQLNDEQREFTSVIRQSGEMLLVVINEILDYSKAESGRLELEWLPFDLRAGVEGSVDLIADTAREKRLDLMYLVEPEVPDWIHGDLTRVRQVLVNLVSNAVKFTERGEVVVSVRVVPAAQGADAERPLELEFCVRDTGIGIDDDKMPRLFQPFTQMDSGTTRKYGGTGLGLAICKRLVEAMGGKLWAESDGAGKGSRFYFNLPTAPAASVDQLTPPAPPPLRARRALLVNDNPTELRILALQAERCGMTQRSCLSGGEALSLLEAGEGFDVVVTDVQMEGMDGNALAQGLRRLRPALPIVGLSSTKVRQSGAAASLFAAVLLKPARQQALLDAIAAALSASRAADAPMPPAVKQFDPLLGKRLPLRILVVEDNEVNQRVALRMLSSFGYQADLAGNGLEAVDAVRRQTYDLLLMDVQMPEMDGLEATRSIVRTSDPPQRPRIVAMSASAMREDVDAALASGMDDYVVKPIAVSALRSVLESCGESRRMRDTAAS